MFEINLTVIRSMSTPNIPCVSTVILITLYLDRFQTVFPFE